MTNALKRTPLYGVHESSGVDLCHLVDGRCRYAMRQNAEGTSLVRSHSACLMSLIWEKLKLEGQALEAQLPHDQ